MVSRPRNWGRLLPQTLCVFSFAVSSWLSTIDANDLLKVIPANALGFVAINFPQKSCDTVGKVTQAAKLPAPPLAPLLQQLVVFPSMDLTRPWAIAVIPDPSAEGLSKPLIVIPIRNQADVMKEAKRTGKEKEEIVAVPVVLRGSATDCWVGFKNGYAVAIPQSEGGSARELLVSVLADAGSPDKSLLALERWTDLHDIVVIVSDSGINSAAKMMVQGIDNLSMQLGGTFGNTPQAQQVESGMKMYRSMATQAPAELNQVILGFRIQPEGHLHLASRLLFDSKGAMAKAFASIPASTSKPLENLPPGKYALAAAGPFLPSLTASMLDMSGGMMFQTPGMENVPQASRDQYLGALRTQMQEVRSMTIGMQRPQQGRSLYSGILGTMEVSKSAEYLKTSMKVVEFMKSLGEKAKSPWMGANTTTSITIDGKPGLKVSISKAAFSAMPNAEQLGPMLALMFGPNESLDMFMSAVDPNLVLYGYESEEAVKKMAAHIKDHKASLATDPSFLQVKTLLPDGCQWIACLNLAEAIKVAADVAREVAPAGQMNLPTLPESPPVAFGMRGESTELQTDLVIPAATWQPLVSALQGAGG